MASFYVIRGKDNGQHFAIRGANATIGREAVNQIQLRDSEVSRQHARIIRTDESNFELVDNRSSNGTFVNGRRVESQELRSGDRVQVGRTLMIFTGGPDLHSTHSVKAIEIVNEGGEEQLSQIRSKMDSHLGLAMQDQSSAVRDNALDSATGQDIDNDSASSDELDSRVGLQTGRPADLRNLEMFYEVSQAINRTADLSEVLSQVLDLIFRWIDCDRGCILMNDDITGQLTPIASLDSKAKGSAAESKVKLTISRTILDHVCQSRKGVLTCNAQDDERWQKAESVAKLGVHEAICVPMQGRYGFVGAIYVDTSVSLGTFVERKAKTSFNDDHLMLMMAIAGQAALAIEDTQFYRAMVQSERLAVMGQTIANLSHHVKNILQGVSGGNYLVDDGLKNGDLQIVEKGWKIVQRNQERISNLVMDMLSYSKQREPEWGCNDLRGLVDDVVQLVKTRAAANSVVVEWRRPESPLLVSYDNEAIHRALLNVVTNAIDAAQASAEALVVIEAEFDDEMVVVTVSDNGPGIAEEDIPRIFSPFESTKGASGTGLGLPVSQKILREHRGDITVQSQPGQGTDFILHWPCQVDESGPATQPG